MKKLKIVATLIVIFLLFNCSEDRNKVNDNFQLVDLNLERLLDEGELNQINNIAFRDDEFKEVESSIWSRTNDNVLNSLENLFFSTKDFSNNYGFVIYSDNYMKTVYNLDGIIGFSHYTIIDNELLHKAYLIDDGKVVAGDEFLDYQAVDLIFNDIDFMVTSYFSKMTDERMNITILQSDSKFNTFEKFDGLFLKRRFHDSTSSDLSKTNKLPEEPDCVKMCNITDSDGDYCYGDECRGTYPGGGGDTGNDGDEDGTCPLGKMQDDKVVNSELLILEDIYEFRDETMANYNMGVTYTNYYYIMSRLFDDNPFLYIEAGNSIPTLISLMNRVQSNDNSTIFINNSTKIELIDLMNEFRSTTTNVYFLAMFDEIIRDINLYSNKTLTQIYAEIN